jgi:intracellular multiplication protein IcmO
VSDQSRIHGPLPEDERPTHTLMLDTRPFYQRAAEALQHRLLASSALAGAAALILELPFIADFVLPVAIAFAIWVMTRPVRLPLDMPERSRRKDLNDLDPETRKPRMAAGRDYLGRERFTGRQVWQAMKRSVQHRIFFGTTGAGKTVAMIGATVANAIAQGSGCIYVDGKGSPDVYTEIMALAREAGREDDVQVLSFLGGESNTTNPFAEATADMIREILVGQLNEEQGQNAIFHGRAVALLTALAPVMRWIGDNKSVLIDLERIRDAMELHNIARIVQDREIKFRYTATGTEETISIEGCPREYLRGLESYLSSSGGFDVGQGMGNPKLDKPVEQHSYIEMQFTEVFTQWLIGLGHIFRVPRGDVDPYDVVINRRILVVLLPSLKSSTKTTQGLGKYLVAMLKATMGQVLGDRLQGDYADVIEHLPTNSPTAFKVDFDEAGAYATTGMNDMFQMARSMNFEFNMGLQETSSIKAALGARAAAVLGNPNTVLGMRLQEPDTGKMVEDIGGETKVAQIVQQASAQDFFGTFKPAEAASIQAAKRYNWLDLRNLKEGQAILSYGNRLVHMNMFWCRRRSKPQATRINEYLMLGAPDRARILRHRRSIAKIRTALLVGPIDPVDQAPLSRNLLGLLQAFNIELRTDKPAYRAAYDAVFACPDLDPANPDEAPGGAGDDEQEPGDSAAGDAPADHAFSELLRNAIHNLAPVANFPDPGRLGEAEQALVEQLEEVERAGGRRGEAAKRAARQAVGGLRVAFGESRSKQERISTHKLLGMIDGMISALQQSTNPTEKR